MTPDEVRYTRAGARLPVARPFHYRWLLPRLCGTDERRWRAVQLLAAAGLCALTAVHAGVWWAAFLPVGCAGLLRFNLNHPRLVDLPAITVALGAAVAWDHHLPSLAIVLAWIAGTMKETAPVFAAAYALHPALLVGLIGPAIRHLLPAGRDCLDDENTWILAHPFRAAVKYHRALPAWVWVLPWGAGLLATPSWHLGLVLLVAYAQCAAATDTVRLYQWAAPQVAAALAWVPARWVPVLVLVHLVNPFRTEGV